MNNCRVRDVLILDTLIRLAIFDDSTDRRELSAILKEYSAINGDWDKEEERLKPKKKAENSESEEKGARRKTGETVQTISKNNDVAKKFMHVAAMQTAYVNMQQKAIQLMNQHYDGKLLSPKSCSSSHIGETRNSFPFS